MLTSVENPAQPLPPSHVQERLEEDPRHPVGFQYLVIESDLRRYGWTGDRHAVRSYSWIIRREPIAKDGGHLAAVLRQSPLQSGFETVGGENGGN